MNAKSLHADFVRRLRQLLLSRGRKAAAVSRAIGRHSGTIADILSGKNKNPGFALVANIAAELDSPLDYFIGKTDSSEAMQRARVQVYVVTVRNDYAVTLVKAFADIAKAAAYCEQLRDETSGRAIVQFTSVEVER